jgi:peptidylprolyl isomerase
MTFKLLIALPVVALSSVLALTACGQQADDRVAVDESSASVDVGGDSDGGADDGTMTAPYVSLNCVTMEAVPADTPPAEATTIGDVSASFDGSGVPTLTIATASLPAETLGIADLIEGDGPEVQPGNTVTVNYCGAGLDGQVVFDSSWARGEPIAFPLDGLIPGWQEGIPGMKVGGQRLLVIPGPLGYGESGAPGIAPNETLAFVIELLAASA